jgi:hypothetical protein
MKRLTSILRPREVRRDNNESKENSYNNSFLATIFGQTSFDRATEMIFTSITTSAENQKLPEKLAP